MYLRTYSTLPHIYCKNYRSKHNIQVYKYLITVITDNIMYINNVIIDVIKKMLNLSTDGRI